MYKSAVIGSNGYLGSHMAHFLEKEGFDNHNYDLQEQGISDVSKYQQLDVTEKAAFNVIDADVDYIFLFSGLSGTKEGFENYEKYFAVNELGLVHLLSWMRQSGCRARVVFPSTRLVYKGQKKQPLKEEDAKETRTIYASNKLAAEHILWSYQNAFGIDHTIFRICVPYGNMFDGGYSYGTTGFMIDRALNQKVIPLYGNGSLRRTFTHVEDICRNIIDAVKSPTTKNEIYNIGGENLSLYEAALIISKKLDAKVSCIQWPELDYILETGDTIFDDAKLKSAGFANYRQKFKDFLPPLP